MARPIGWHSSTIYIEYHKNRNIIFIWCLWEYGFFRFYAHRILAGPLRDSDSHRMDHVDQMG